MTAVSQITAIACCAVFLTTVARADKPVVDDDRDGDKIDQAEQLIDDLEYERARDVLRSALRTGNNSRTATADIYRLLGQIAASFGKTDRAEKHFARALVIRPKLQLPDGLAPKIKAPFLRAKSRLGGDRLTVATDTAEDGTVEVEVTNDPMRLGHSAVLRYRSRSGSITRSETDRVPQAEIAIPVDIAKPSIVVMILDRHGNTIYARKSRLPAHVLQAAIRDEQLEARADDVDTSARPRSRSVFARWYVWGLASAAAGGTATYFGIKARDNWDRLETMLNDSGQYTGAQAAAIQTAGRRNQLYSNIAAGTAGVMGAVSLYLLVDTLLDDSSERPRRRIAPMAVRSGAGVSVRLGF